MFSYKSKLWIYYGVTITYKFNAAVVLVSKAENN